MRGGLISCIGVVLVILFSGCTFLSSDVLMMWILMELASISLVPCFFFSGGSGMYVSLFSYVLMSSLASGLIASGFLFESCSFFMYIGLLVKFGVFPFMGWVYLVLTGSNWLVSAVFICAV